MAVLAVAHVHGASRAQIIAINPDRSMAPDSAAPDRTLAPSITPVIDNPPSPNDDAAPPIITKDNDDDNFVCQVCADRSNEPTNDRIVPIADLSCRTIYNEPIPQVVCVTIKSYLELGAYCGCPGEQAPNYCPLCNGGPISDSNASIALSNDLSLTCREAQFLATLVQEPVCETVVRPLEGPCCLDGRVEAPTPTAAAVTFNPTVALTFAPQDSTPNATAVNDDSAGERRNLDMRIPAILFLLTMMAWQGVSLG